MPFKSIDSIQMEEAKLRTPFHGNSILIVNEIKDVGVLSGFGRSFFFFYLKGDFGRTSSSYNKKGL